MPMNSYVLIDHMWEDENQHIVRKVLLKLIGVAKDKQYTIYNLSLKNKLLPELGRDYGWSVKHTQEFVAKTNALTIIFIARKRQNKNARITSLIEESRNSGIPVLLIPENENYPALL